MKDKMISELREWESHYRCMSNICWPKFDEILSRYRPSTQADIVGELRKYKEGLCYQASCCGIGVPRELKTRIEELDRVIEIIRKHEGAK